MGNGSNFPGVRILPSIVEFPESGLRLYFETKSDNPLNGVDVWSSGVGGTVALSTLEAQSGIGKTTIANSIYQLLDKGTTTQPSVIFGEPFSHREVTAAMLPQKANSVLHWKASDLLPRQPRFLDCLFFDDPAIEKKVAQSRLAQFSGGQMARILVCSALERLFKLGGNLNFLILDEAFEGISAEYANQILKLLTKKWSNIANERHLYLLLVTHLDMSRIGEGITLLRTALRPLTTRDVFESGRAVTETRVLVQHV